MVLAPLLNVPAHLVHTVDPIYLHAAQVRLLAQKLADAESKKKS